MSKDGLRRTNFRVKNLDISGTLSGAYSNGGQTYYVDSAVAVSGGGTAWDDTFSTIAAAVAQSLADGGTHDTILVRGTDNQDSDSSAENDYSESVTIAASQVGLRIIGCGNGPEGILWTVGTAEGDILTVNAKDCYVSGFRFRPNGATSGTAIKLVTTSTMSTNPTGFIVENCIFRSTTETALAAISINGTNDVTIRNNVFTSVATAVLSVSPPHSVQYRTIIENNFVDDKCTSGIDIECRSGVIRNNVFSSGLTIVVSTKSLGGTLGKDNVVSDNMLPCGTNFATNCEGCTGDTWLNNSTDAISEGAATTAEGRTYAIPGAT